MLARLTNNQLRLLKKSLKHSIDSGQFFFNIDETEKMRKVLKELQKKYKKPNDKPMA